MYFIGLVIGLTHGLLAGYMFAVLKRNNKK
jgi:hypothetical protein